MFCHSSAQITSLISFPSPKLALEFIKGLDNNVEATAVDAPTSATAVPVEDAPLAEAVPTETEEAKDV